MRVNQRLVVKFSIQFVMVLISLIFCSIIGLLILSFAILERDTKEDFSKISGDFLQQSIDLTDGKVSLRDNIKKRIMEQNGWFQIIDKNGEVQYSLNATRNIPLSYSKQQIIEMTSNHSKDIAFWSIEVDKESYIALFGSQITSGGLIKVIQEQLEQSTKKQLESEKIEKELSRLKANLYIYDNYGNLWMEYVTNQNLTEPSLFQIVESNDDYWEETENIATYHDNELDKSYVLITPNINYEEYMSSSTDLNQTVLKGIAITLCVLLILLFVLSWWFARNFGNPILHIIHWLQLLAKGVYEEPLGKSMMAYSLKSNGNLKSSFKPFKEILNSLRKLTNTLKENELQQRKIQETREEWIAGLSHDLKTPLSSIYGYAVMLNSSVYNWTDEEIHEFYSSIEQSSSYMSDLIEDLNLTYRIKNNALPIYKEKVDINQFIKEVVNQYANTHVEKHHEYTLETENKPLFYEVDKKYFKRIIVNLLCNAAKYNPEGTLIGVVIKKRENGFNIHVQDNGIGIDEYTEKNLFNRYFRGTSVEEKTDGTGLGLAITKQLVELHHGTVEVDTVENQGTKITLIFIK